MRAVCLDDAADNACIDRVQRVLLKAAVRKLEERESLYGKPVLDYGCGTGRWVPFLQRLGCRYSGVDIAREMLEIARRRHPEADLKRVGDAGLPYADRSFDLVWSIAVVHHNPHGAQEKIVAEMGRVLKDDGALLLFEGLGAMHPSSPVYYPRPLPEWLALAGRHGMECSWYRGTSYFILRSFIAHLARGTAGSFDTTAGSGTGRPEARPASWRSLVRRIDAIVDPCLLSLLPQKHHTRAAMLFRKHSAYPAPLHS